MTVVDVTNSLKLSIIYDILEGKRTQEELIADYRRELAEEFGDEAQQVQARHFGGSWSLNTHTSHHWWHLDP